MNKIKNPFKELKNKFYKTKFKRNLSKMIDFLENKLLLGRTKTKLLLVIIFLLFFCFIDILWLIMPTPPKKAPGPEYKPEEIPGLIMKYKTELETNPKSFKAHYELGKLYLVIKEKEKSKVELFQAIECAPEGNYDAHFALSKTYLNSKEPEMSEKMLENINTNKAPEQILLKKADSLLAISRLYYSQYKFRDSYSTLQQACNYYEKIKDEKKLEEAKKDMMLLLIDMADEAYYKEKNPTKAMIYLNNSQDIEENALVYAKLGYLLFEDPKASADYFEKAYNFDSKAVNPEIFIPALRRAINISIEENRLSDKSYFQGVLERVTQGNLSSTVHSKIILNNVEGFFEKQEDTDEYLPVIYVDIYNAFANKNIPYLKIRAVFVTLNDEIVGHQDVIAINYSAPLPPGKTKNTIRLESNRLITSKDKSNTVYKAILFISETRPDEWSYATNKMLR